MFRRILVGFDGSPSAWRALRRALWLAREQGAALHALAVEEPLPRYAAARTTGRPAVEDYFARLLAEAQREAAGQGVTLETAVVRDYAARAIVEHADRIGADLIVIGTGVPTGMIERVLGSTADRVVDIAHCSVLVVREPAARR